MALARISSVNLRNAFSLPIGKPSAKSKNCSIISASSAFSEFHQSKLFHSSFLNQECHLSRPYISNDINIASIRNYWRISSAYAYPPEDPGEATKRALAIKQIENSAASFKRLGRLGFWAQLVCSVVSAVILVFSIYISGRPTSPVTTYLTAGGIVAAFLSVFWSFGYMRLADRLKEVLNTNLEKAPSRTSVVDNLKSGLVINLVGMATTLLGLQATVGLLVAKALSSSVTPIAQGISASYNPVLALDVFLVQASSNTLLSHFLGLIFTLELIRITTRPQPPAPILPKPAPGSFLS